jgi:hypothetical protein
MHAALISLLLMSGTCGATPSQEAMPAPSAQVEVTVGPQAPPVTVSAPMIDPTWLYPTPVTVSVPPIHVPAGCGCIGHQSCNYPDTWMYGCCNQADPPGPTTCPAWETGYRPACYFYPNHRMLFDPADYTIPYDYRERFNYPWNDPRCPCAHLPIRP